MKKVQNQAKICIAIFCVNGWSLTTWAESWVNKDYSLLFWGSNEANVTCGCLEILNEFSSSCPYYDKDDKGWNKDIGQLSLTNKRF